MLAIHAVYLKNNPIEEDKLDFIETPPVKYLDELESLLNSVEHQKLIDAILSWTDESVCVKIALSLNDQYEIDSDRTKLSSITEYLGNSSLDSFVKSFKSFAEKIKWDDFFINHQKFYNTLFSKFCAFPENLDLKDLEDFYGTKKTSYNYIPSILMNGGFSHKDKLGNIYYIRGFEWDIEKKEFDYDKKYLLECLFHEFSHPVINPLVDKYLSNFTNLDKLKEEALKNNLPKTYSEGPIILYEYLVRANANILTKKYYNTKISDWILSHGFNYLEELIDYILQNIGKYDNYEDFFKNEMIPFINDMTETY